MVPVIHARVTATGNAPPLSAARTFPCDELADVVDAARVEHIGRLDPAATGGAESEPHLPGECVRAVTIAVDRHGDSDGNSAACQRAVHVQVPGRTVDLHRGTS